MMIPTVTAIEVRERSRCRICDGDGADDKGRRCEFCDGSGRAMRIEDIARRLELTRLIRACCFEYEIGTRNAPQTIDAIMHAFRSDKASHKTPREGERK